MSVQVANTISLVYPGGCLKSSWPIPSWPNWKGKFTTVENYGLLEWKGHFIKLANYDQPGLLGLGQSKRKCYTCWEKVYFQGRTHGSPEKLKALRDGPGLLYTAMARQLGLQIVPNLPYQTNLLTDGLYLSYTDTLLLVSAFFFEFLSESTKSRIHSLRSPLFSSTAETVR